MKLEISLNKLNKKLFISVCFFICFFFISLFKILLIKKFLILFQKKEAVEATAAIPAIIYCKIKLPVAGSK